MQGGPPLAWEPDKGSHIGVMARDADVSTMRWFTTDACYVFHPMNAWEDGDKIYADVMEYPVAPLFPTLDGSRAAATRSPSWRAGPSTSPATRTPSSASRSTTWRASSRASTSVARVSPTGTAGSRGSPAATATRCGSTRSPTSTSRAASASTTSTPPATRPASRSSCRASRARPRATAGWWRWSIAAPRTAAISWSTTRRTWPPARSPRPGLPRRVPFGFHGNWRAA